jgi:hypothetical protein
MVRSHPGSPKNQEFDDEGRPAALLPMHQDCKKPQGSSQLVGRRPIVFRPPVTNQWAVFGVLRFWTVGCHPRRLAAKFRELAGGASGRGNIARALLLLSIKRIPEWRAALGARSGFEPANVICGHSARDRSGAGAKRIAERRMGTAEHGRVRRTDSSVPRVTGTAKVQGREK